MEIPLPEKKMAYCIIENRRKPFTKIKDLLSLWKLPASTRESMKIQSNMPTFCFHGKSVSNIFPLVFTKSKNFLHNYMLAIRWVEDCSWAFLIQYTDSDTVYLPPAKLCRRVHAAFQNVYAKILDKSKSTPCPLLLIKQIYINSMAGNSEKYCIVGAADRNT